MNTISSDMSMVYSSLQAQNLQSGQKAGGMTEEAEETSQTAVSRAQRMDVVEISAAGRQAMAAASEQQAKGAEASAALTASTAEVKTSEDTTSLNSLSQEERSSVSTSELYTATESELKTLVSDGSITRAEMEAELARRNGAAAEVQAAES